jgi:septum formation protein
VLHSSNAHLPLVILASASPRRAELLRAAGIPFEVHPAHVDESVRAGESPDVYVMRVAKEKASAIAARLPHRVVLAADTTVVVDEQILSKPEDEDDARRMLRMLSGRVHEVLSGVCLCGPAEVDAAKASPAEAGRDDSAGHYAPTICSPQKCEIRLERTSVAFARLTDDEIAWYVSSGEPMDKAGAYAIQGLASRFVTSIDGSYSNVVGLPVALVCEMLKSHAIARG